MATTTLMTAEQLVLLNPQERCELVAGELRMMSPSGWRHAEVISILDFLLTQHVRQHRLGKTFGAEGGFLLSRNPDTVRGADWAFVARENLPGQKPMQAFWPGPPDMAVEVLSPSDRAGAVREKNEAWLAAGVKLLWVVDPEHETVTIYRSPADVIVKTGEDTLDGGDILPGFRCRVAEIFTPIA